MIGSRSGWRTLTLALAICALTSGFADLEAERLRIRYVANAGVMLTIDGTKVLIDAPIREGIPPYATSSPDERRRLEGAAAPYDDVAAILITHWHEDHFSPQAIVEHLRHNSRAVLISSREVVERVRVVAPGLGNERFAARTPSQGDSAIVTVGPLKVHVLRAKHNPTRRWPEEHVAFLIEGSETALHTGDAELSPENFAVLQRLPKVNVALLPYWHLLNDKTVASTIRPLIRPDRTIGMHLPQSDAEQARRDVRRTMPGAVLLVAPGTEAGATPQDVERPKVVWPTSGWTRATPESQGISSARFSALDREIETGVYGNIDRILVARNGYLIVDERYSRDYRALSRGHTGPLGCGEGCTETSAMHEFNYYHPNWHPYYQGRDVHTLQSVTKSIAATVIGIALARGEISGVDVPFLSFFKERDLSRVDARLRRATLQDLLTMRSGIEWHESDRPLDGTNTTYQLEKSKDWIQFTLDQPMDAAPGTKWTYNSGGSQLLSGIVTTATGRHIDEYAAERLFRPLGIRDFHWKKTPTGHPDTEGGLYLSAHDLAKIGLLYLRGGEWAGTRILAPGWTRTATTRHVTGLRGGWDYGYQWWITTRKGADVWAGRGFGGQLLIVVPSRDIVAVVQAWNVFGGPARPIFEPFVAALTD